MTQDRNMPPGHKPPRAKPIQPDRPGGSDDIAAPPDDASRADETIRESVRRQKRQSDAALDNVREGYD
jgi:hypothetical protein